MPKLKELAVAEGLSGVSKLRKDDLVKVLSSHFATKAPLLDTATLLDCLASEDSAKKCLSRLQEKYPSLFPQVN